VTTLAHRPPLGGPANGGIAARRALIRWAGRMFRREWRQHVLVVALLTVAVAAATGSIAVVYNTSPADNAEFGSADRLLRFDGADPRKLKAGLAAVKRSFRTIDVIGHRSLGVPGGVETVDFRAQEPHGPYGRGLLAVRRGHYPVGPGQVAVTDGVAELLRLRLGSTLALDGRRRTVVGIVENPRKLSDEFALVSPTSAGPPEHVTVLLGASSESVTSFIRQSLEQHSVRRLRRPPERPGGGHAGDVLRSHRLPAAGLADRRRRRHQHARGRASSAAASSRSRYASFAHPTVGQGAAHQFVVRAATTSPLSLSHGSWSLPSRAGSRSLSTPALCLPASAIRAARRSDACSRRSASHGGT
jgi:hypothetical protein